MTTLTPRRWGRRRTALFAAVCLTTAALVVQTPGFGQPPSATAADAAQPWMDTKLSADARAKLLVAQMTLDEKVTLVSGAGAGQRWDMQPIPRLGIPGGDNIDSGLGLREADLKTTSFPSGLSQASSYSAEAAKSQGKALGNETFLTGQNQLLGPTIDISRNPYHGREFENYGEDPLLTRELGGQNIAGIESNPVIAVVKHYVSNTQETHRTSVDEHVDERALHEIYLPPFEGAVSVGAGAVMCSLNQVNTDYVCQDKELLTNVLRDQLGFKGFVQTDYDSLGAAAADPANTVKAAMSGLDADLPNGSVFGKGGTKLKAAIEAGQVPVAQLDAMVLRILTSYFSHGLFDHPAPGIFDPNYVRQQLPQDVATANDNLALQLGQQGSVLLKNNGLLPLSSDKVKSIAVIGADANWNIQGGGSAAVNNPTNLTTYLAGIQQRSGAKVEYAPGTDVSSYGDMVGGPAPIPSSVLIPEHQWNPVDRGLHAEFWQNGTIGAPLTGDYIRLDKQANSTIGLLGHLNGIVQTPNYPLWIGGIPSAHGWVGKWTGQLVPPTTGTYTLSATHWGSARLVVDGQEIIPKTVGHDMNTVTTAQVNLTAGKAVPIEFDYWHDEPTSFIDHGGAQFRLGWVPPADALSPDMQAAVDAAKRNDVAVVVVRDVNSESADRGNLTLPQDQNRLIEAVAKANPKTIVIGATGSAYPMPWINDVGAVLQTWYAGQEQGKVAASILYGDVNPSGKLPVSFPTADDQQPINTPAQWPGIDDVATHTEGIYVGYRGYDKNGIKPLFPFGYGLSYTTFDYSKLKVKDPDLTANGGKGKPGSVEVQVTNAGKTAGTETVQVYEGTLPTSVDTPSRQLVGWAKVALAPGETKTASVTIDVAKDHALSYWDVNTHAWVTPKGDVPIYVGSSESDTKLEGTVKVDHGPVATTAPSIQGTVEVGQRVEANPGVWDTANLKFSYQWLRDGQPIARADGRQYTITEKDAGTALSVQVTATPRKGAAGTAVSSAAKVSDGAPTVTRAPSVAGTPEVGKRIEADPGAWSKSIQRYSYQWLRDGKPIKGAVDRRYTITKADTGTSLSVQVTATPRTGLPGVAVSNTVKVVDARPVATTAPAIEGKARVGSRVTADPGVWNQKKLTFSYQWLRNGKPIKGAVDRQYRITAADAGTALTVQVTATPKTGAAGTAISKAVHPQR